MSRGEDAGELLSNLVGRAFQFPKSIRQSLLSEAGGTGLAPLSKVEQEATFPHFPSSETNLKGSADWRKPLNNMCVDVHLAFAPRVRTPG